MSTINFRATDEEAEIIKEKAAQWALGADAYELREYGTTSSRGTLSAYLRYLLSGDATLASRMVQGLLAEAAVIRDMTPGELLNNIVLCFFARRHADTMIHGHGKRVFEFTKRKEPKVDTDLAHFATLVTMYCKERDGEVFAEKEAKE